MDNRINIAVIVGVVLTLAFAVTFTQTDNQGISQDEQESPLVKADVHSEMPYKHFSGLEKTVDVVGTATESVEPDTLMIEFGVETVAGTAKEALEQNSEMLLSAIGSLKAAGITDNELSTSRLNIYPVYQSHEDLLTGRYVQEIVGFQASNVLSIETDQLSDAAKIIDLAIENGANRVDFVSFTVSPPKVKSVKESLIEEAVLDAKAKAKIAIKPLNQKIVGVSSVVVNDSGYSPAPMLQRAEMFAGSAPIYSSDQDISVNVNVIFLIADV
jgi:uncharacterized protein YggE